MSNDYIEIGCSPYDEDKCVQVSDKVDYRAAMRHECEVFCRQLQRVYNPQHCQLAIKSFPHDFGSYLSVVASYDDENEAAVDEAFAMEAGCAKWDDEAFKELWASEVYKKYIAEYAIAKSEKGE